MRVVGVPGGRIVLAGDGARLAALADPNLSGSDQTLAFDLTADGRPRWLRVDVRDAGGRLVLLGNPIYLRP